MATFRLAGAGKATLKLVVSSWGYEYPEVEVRVMGLTRIVSGSRGRDTPGQALLCLSRDRLARNTGL